jgi:hypothetical protein
MMQKLTIIPNLQFHVFQWEEWWSIRIRSTHGHPIFKKRELEFKSIGQMTVSIDLKACPADPRRICGLLQE